VGCTLRGRLVCDLTGRGKWAPRFSFLLRFAISLRIIESHHVIPTFTVFSFLDFPALGSHLGVCVCVCGIWGSGCIDPLFFTSALAGDEWSASRPGRFTPGTHWIGGWVDPRAGLDDLETRKFLTLPRLELRPLSPARSQSLYRLRSTKAQYVHKTRPSLAGFYIHALPRSWLVVQIVSLQRTKKLKLSELFPAALCTCRSRCRVRNIAYSGGWSPNGVHSAPRPFTVLLCLPRVIVRMENYSVE
jgi:hypothetical protein